MRCALSVPWPCLFDWWGARWPAASTHVQPADNRGTKCMPSITLISLENNIIHYCSACQPVSCCVRSGRAQTGWSVFRPRPTRVLLLLSIDDRQIYVSAGKGAVSRLTASVLDGIIDDAKGPLRVGNTHTRGPFNVGERVCAPRAASTGQDAHGQLNTATEPVARAVAGIQGGGESGEAPSLIIMAPS
eukprot:365297-Chlamydomonas_euryale.AAC.6